MAQTASSPALPKKASEDPETTEAGLIIEVVVKHVSRLDSRKLHVRLKLWSLAIPCFDT